MYESNPTVQVSNLVMDGTIQTTKAHAQPVESDKKKKNTKDYKTTMRTNKGISPGLATFVQKLQQMARNEDVLRREGTCERPLVLDEERDAEEGEGTCERLLVLDEEGEREEREAGGEKGKGESVDGGKEEGKAGENKSKDDKEDEEEEDEDKEVWEFRGSDPLPLPSSITLRKCPTRLPSSINQNGF
ncbi:hypothetical protein DFH27DRAFT_645281 [Peziza echinospora]|nr:hypothetical protein DFH27DRAFT_645281 [Peziza echinospora]